MSYIIDLSLSNNTSSIFNKLGSKSLILVMSLKKQPCLFSIFICLVVLILYDVFNKKMRRAYSYFTYLMVHLISFFNNNLVIFFMTVN